MKKIINLLVLTAIMQQAFSQTETFDIITYTPPKDFKKDSKQGVVNYSHVNTSTGTFCVIAMYASRPSAGDVQKDFTNDWNELVVTPFKAEANPKTETQTTAEGWETVTAAAPIKLDGADLYIILTVASGFGKTISIRTSLNDASYTAQVDALFESMVLDKTKSPTATNNNTQTEQTNKTEGKFGLMTYTAPEGWRHQVFNDGVVFKPLDLPAEELLAIQIMQSMSFSGSLEDALAKSYEEAITMYNATPMWDVNGGNYSALPAKTSFLGWDYIRCSGGIHMGGGNYPPEYGLDLFVIKINNRFERVAILKSRTNCNLSRYYSADRVKYTNAIENFLFSLKFTDEQKIVLEPGTLHGNGIIGVWQGISLSVGPSSVTNPLGAGYKVFSPIFLSNGQAYFGPHFPTEGLVGIDTHIPPELHRRDWGTYSFSNGRGTLKMPYGDIPMRMDGDKLIITANQTDHRFFQLPSVDGARFSGTYMLNDEGKNPSITLSADGKFTDHGAIKVLCHEYIDCINPGLLPGSGTYEVKDYSITFHYSDGRKIKMAFMGNDFNKNNQSPARLVLSSNEDVLYKQ